MSRAHQPKSMGKYEAKDWTQLDKSHLNRERLPLIAPQPQITCQSLRKPGRSDHDGDRRANDPDHVNANERAVENHDHLA